MHIHRSKIEDLRSIVSLHGYVSLTEINFAWVDARIQQLKRIGKIVPTTIQEEVGALARRMYEGMRKGLLIMSDHALDRRRLQIFSFLFWRLGKSECAGCQIGLSIQIGCRNFKQAGAQGQKLHDLKHVTKSRLFECTV